jgi:hypothetical protein
VVFARRTHAAQTVESGRTAAAGEGGPATAKLASSAPGPASPPTVQILPAPAPQLWVAAARRGEDSSARRARILWRLAIALRSAGELLQFLPCPEAGSFGRPVEAGSWHRRLPQFLQFLFCSPYLSPFRGLHLHIGLVHSSSGFVG